MKKVTRKTPCKSVKTDLASTALSIWCGCCTPDHQTWVLDPAGRPVRIDNTRLAGLSVDNPYPWLRAA